MDALRGGAVFLVVFHHVLVFLGGNWFQVPAWLATVNWALGFARMPTLLLLSGFLAQGIMKASRGRIFWRCANLAWLVLLWTPVVLLSKSTGETIGLPDILREMARPNTELWFLWALVVLAFIPIVVRAGVSRYVLLAVFFALSTALWSDYLRPSFFAAEQIGRYGMYFVVGCLFLDDRAMKALHRRSAAYGVALPLIGLALHLAKAGGGGSLTYALLSIPEALCFALGAVALVSAIPADYLVRTPIARLGRNTLPVYVCHIPVIMGLTLIDLSAPDAFSPLAALTAAVVVTMICLAFQRIANAWGLAFLFHVPRRLQARVNGWVEHRWAR